MSKRFRFKPFWTLTNKGFLSYAFRVRPGADEYHNPSRHIVVPLVGMFTWYDKGVNFDQPYHIAGWTKSTGEIWMGVYVPGCPICEEIMATMKEGHG